MTIKVPELSLILMVGISGSGKSSFARKHFAPYEIVSSDVCRGVVSNDENDQKATGDAFELLHYIVGKRLKKGLLTVVDATNIQAAGRKQLLQLAKRYHVLPGCIVLNIPEAICKARNAERPDRNFGKHVLRHQQSQLRASLRKLKSEGFRKITILNSEGEVNAVESIVREKLYNNKKDIHGPFDIIGDVHACFDELEALLTKLGYTVNRVEEEGQNYGFEVLAPADRTAVFVGDLIDRGPNSPDVLRLAMSMVRAGTAYCVPGNHDVKLQKYLKGKKVKVSYGLQETIDQLEGASEAFLKDIEQFLYELTSHYVFDDGKLVVAHAGLREDMQGRASGACRSFCLYGDTEGKLDENGFVIRYDWAQDYRGEAKVVYGHVVVRRAQWLNNTIDIDTGCVFGGELTALRYPEMELVAVKAAKNYYPDKDPLAELIAKEELNRQQAHDDLLHIEDLIGQRIVQTRLRPNIKIKEENAIAALEVMSRFAIDPKWLMYLPPTMSPCETSEYDDFLEHPQEAISYFQKNKVRHLICEEKHMGSRAVVVIAKDEDVVLDRFGLQNVGIGICYTRTGRNFFTDEGLEKAFLEAVRDTLSKSGFWERMETDWVCMDCELMPWSAKAQALLKGQYAAVGAAATNGLTNAVRLLQSATSRGIDIPEEIAASFSYRQAAISKYQKAYRQYCWTVNDLKDFKLAPFHILATEGKVHVDKNHQWHMEEIHRICAAGPDLFRATAYKLIDTESPASIQAAIDWWLSMTEAGGEGMVVKPLDFIAYGPKGLVQPAVKCRGKEYLRIIYGPEYDMPKHLARLKRRGLNRKRSLAFREFTLGIEALERFVDRAPLRKVHEAVFGVLALESEEVDPRL